MSALPHPRTAAFAPAPPPLPLRLPPRPVLRPGLFLVVWLALALVASLSLAGCADAAQIRAEIGHHRAQAAAAIDSLDARRAALQSHEAALAQADPTDASALALRAQVQDSLADLAQRRAAVEHALQRLTDLERDLAALPPAATDPGVAVEGAMTHLLPFVPAPAQGVILFGAGVLIAAIRARQFRKGLESVVAGLEVAMRDDPAFRDAFRTHANTFRATQSPLARTVVDEVRARRARAGATTSSPIPPTLRPELSPPSGR